MPLNLYDAAVPVFRRYLEQTAALVLQAEAFCHAKGLAPETLLTARLIGDMLPWHKQVEIAVNFSFRTCYPLAGQAIPDYGDVPASFAGLQAHIARGLALLAVLSSADFEGAEARTILAEAGQARFPSPASEYLLQYGLPNLLFHFSMAYAILRQQGAPIGKRDFDGFHQYGA